MGKAVKVNPISNAEVADRYLRVVEKRAGKAVRPYRIDGYVNLVNRYGTSKDSSEHYNFQPEPTVPDDVLSVFYEGNGLFAKIIDAPAEEALKKGFTLDGVSDQSVIDFAYESLDELDWEETAMTALKWARLFGGSIAILLINDGRGLEEPLDWKSIKSIDDIRIYDRSVIQPDYSSMFSYDPTDPFGTRGSRLGMPEYYHITSRYGSFTVHDSRCLVFQNGILPENCTNSVYQLWGMPEYVRLRRAIRSTELAHESAPKMLDKSVQPIYKSKNLANLLSTDEGETILLKRLQAIDLARGMLDSIAIDSDGEDYDFKSFQLAGVADIIDATCNYLSALTSIPQTILFGRSPAGMNSTGQSDMENYYNYVERIQKRMLRSNLRYLLSVIFQAGLYTKEVEEVPKIKITFNSLWSATEKEQAELEQMKASIQQTKAQTAQIYVDMSAVDPSEVRKKLASSEEFSIETMLDDYSDDELFENMPQQEEQETDVGGNSPEAAPEATKLPQDMNKSEAAANNDAAETDGGPGSGNFGHKGVTGQIGGSAPSEKPYKVEVSGSPIPITEESMKNAKAGSVLVNNETGDQFFRIEDNGKLTWVTPSGKLRDEIPSAIQFAKTNPDYLSLYEGDGKNPDVFIPKQSGNAPGKVEPNEILRMPKGHEYGGHETSETDGSQYDLIARYVGRENGMAAETLYALNDWSGTTCCPAIKQASDTGKGPKKYLEAAELIDNYCEKAPTWNGGALYRGVSNDKLNSINRMKQACETGSEITMDGIASWSSDQKVAEGFGDAVVICKEGTSWGTSVKGFSQYAKEDEILVSSKAKYKVSSYYTKDGKTYFEVIESNPRKSENKTDGGPGSGNFGHAGRAGEVGGSASGDRSLVSHNIVTPTQAVDKIREFVQKASTDGLTTFKEIKKSLFVFQKNGNLPQLASPENFDETESDYPTIYRGFEKTEQKEQFVNGDIYVGSGFAGAGMNVSLDKRDAESFGGDNVLVMKLAKGAKVIKDDDLMPLFNEVRNSLNAENGSNEEKFASWLGSDPGCVAVALGYDAIYSDTHKWLNIVNRSQLVVRHNSEESDSQNSDGGEGSGNWGHEGVEGQFGGSAPGGGSHNRMTDKNGGYTSFSKEKKRFATPHKVTGDELDKCPDGSKVCFEQDGKRVTYEKNNDGTFTSSSGMALSASEMIEKLSEQGKDAAIYTPDSASPNYSIKRELYTEERKTAAPRTETKENVDDILRRKTENVWKNADDFTKDALFAYTDSDYVKINSSLRKGNVDSDSEVKKSVESISKAISESKLENDMWLARGTGAIGAACFLGISPKAVTGEEDFDVGSLVGKTVLDEAFMSCGSTQGTGLKNAVSYSIYCPKGTEALYAEPFSYYGKGKGRDWNGTDRQENYSSEFETILQRGTKCRITKASRDYYGNLNIEMEVVSQKYKK